MNFKEVIPGIRMKSSALEVVDYIGSDQDKFDELMSLLLSGEPGIGDRGGWIARWCVDQHPELLKKHVEALILNLRRPLSDAVKRNTLRMLMEVEIPISQYDELADHCFRFLESRKEAVAIRVFAMSLLQRICLAYPELAPDLKMVIETYYPHESGAFQSKGKKVLKALQKLING